MIITAISDPGTTERAEDGFIVRPPFVGVVDGDSAPHSLSHPPILFGGSMTGGQMVSNTVVESFFSVSLSVRLEEAILTANRNIRTKQLGQRDLAGGSFAFAKIGKSTVKIITGGDSYALWMLRGDKVGMTSNQAYECDNQRQKRYAAVLQQARGDRQKAWDIYFSFYRQSRRTEDNRSFATLNGSPKIKDCWHTTEISLAEMQTLLLFTDGLVVFKKTKNPIRLAQELAKIYRAKGVAGILAYKRAVEKSEKDSHVTHAEATCVAVDF